MEHRLRWIGLLSLSACIPAGIGAGLPRVATTTARTAIRITASAAAPTMIKILPLLLGGGAGCADPAPYQPGGDPYGPG